MNTRGKHHAEQARNVHTASTEQAEVPRVQVSESHEPDSPSAALAQAWRWLTHSRPMRILWRIVEALIVVIAVGILIATFFISVLQIRGTSMEPTVQEGDVVVANHSTSLSSGDIIAFYYNNKVILKRVIAFSGDWVDIKDDGTVWINGKKLEEDYVDNLSRGQADIVFPYQVPENRYFVLGDHRSVSIDSRSSTIGTVAEEQLIGKVYMKVWPLSDFGRVE